MCIEFSTCQSKLNDPFMLTPFSFIHVTARLKLPTDNETVDIPKIQQSHEYQWGPGLPTSDEMVSTLKALTKKQNIA